MTDDQIPKDFGVRYVLWYTWLGLLVVGKFIWRNAITILSTVSGVFTAITLNDNQTLVSHQAFHSILLANFVLTTILSRIDRRGPQPIDSGGGNSAIPLSQPPEKKP